MASSGAEGIAMSTRHEPSVILLGPDLPDMSSQAVLRLLSRAQGTPVVALLSGDDEDEAVLALEMGAADVLCRPWRVRESAARLWAAIRWASARPGAGPTLVAPGQFHSGGVMVAGPVQVDLDRREVQVRGVRVHARPKDIDLLGLLVAHSGAAVPRERSLNAIWPHLSDRGKVLDAHIRRIRLLVEVDAYHPRHIVTVRSYGHRFDP